jgi:hypothetical protein
VIKATYHPQIMLCIHSTKLSIGKTEEFSQQIEAKQRELEPWTAQINELQSATSVEEAEYNLLMMN